MSYYQPQTRNQNGRRYRSPQSSPNRRYKGYNPFLDNAQENERHQQTLNECNQLNQADTSNPYLNDPVLMNSMKYFNLEQDKQFQNQYSVARKSPPRLTDHVTPNGHHSPMANDDAMEPEVITPQNASNWYGDARESHASNYVQNNGTYFANTHQNQNQNRNPNETAQAEEDKIKIKADNPYHPTNYYKDKEEEQDTAVALVNKYRMSPKDAVKADAVQREYAQFMNSLEAMEAAHHNGYEYNDSFDYSNGYNSYRGYNHNSDKIGIDDMIPGQEMITTDNFNTLQKDDTVWIRNDDGDWEIFKVIMMEKTGGYNQERNCYEETYVGTFKMGDREQKIWQKQTDEEFRMARYIKEPTYAIMEDMYAVNNVFKVNAVEEDGITMNGNFVLKGYDRKSGMADLVCVKTGDKFTVNLSQVEHSIIGN